MLFEELAWHDLYSYSPPALMIFDIWAMGQNRSTQWKDKCLQTTKTTVGWPQIWKRYLQFWPRATYFNQHFFKRRVVFECWQGRMDLLQVDQQLLLAGLGCAKAQESLLRSCLGVDLAVFSKILKKGHENACRQLLQSWRWKTFEACWSLAKGFCLNPSVHRTICKMSSRVPSATVRPSSTKTSWTPYCQRPLSPLPWSL